MSESTSHFIPALGHDWLTPLYDFVAPLVGETAFKRALIAAAAIAPEQRVLDLGCGTGTLALMIAEACPGAQVSGVDIDPRILAIARDKAKRAGAALDLRQGSATAPPFEAGSFDRVLSTLMLHHLTTPQKREAFAAVRRLLRSGGEFHIADWGKPHNPLMQLAALALSWFDGHDNTGANLRGEIPGLLREAGFESVAETQHWMTPFGTLTFVRACAP